MRPNSSNLNKQEYVSVFDAIPEICSPQYISEIDNDTRRRMICKIIQMEGSTKTTAITCIPREKFGLFANRYRKMICKGLFMNDDQIWLNKHIKKIQGDLRGENGHCTECNTEDCEHRTPYTRKELAEISKTIEYTNSRRSKVIDPLNNSHRSVNE